MMATSPCAEREANTDGAARRRAHARRAHGRATRRGLHLACVAAVALAACQAPAPAASPTPQPSPSATPAPVVRIGLGPWVGFGPFYLAQEKGFFAAAGVRVELKVLTGLAERNSALQSGAIDALAAPVDYFVLAAGNRLETTIVMAVDESTGGDGIVARKSIRRVADLRGKRVALQRGLPGEFFLRALLQQQRVSFASLRTTDMETAQAGAAFLAKSVDAAVVWEPWLSRAVDAGGGHVLASTREFPDLIVDCLAFNQQSLARGPREAAAVVAGVLRAIDYWKAHADESNRIMAPHFQVPPETYAKILTGLRFADLARNRAYFGTLEKPGPIFKVAERASAVWLEAQATTTVVNPAEIITTRFVEAR